MTAESIPSEDLFGNWERKGDAARDPGGFGKVVRVENLGPGEQVVMLEVSGPAVRTPYGFKTPRVRVTVDQLFGEWQAVDFTPAEEVPVEIQREQFREAVIRYVEDLQEGRVHDITGPASAEPGTDSSRSV